MIYSMTGYGRVEHAINDKLFIIEIKSLNGKQFDLRLNIPALIKPYELDIRNKLSFGLERGSVECIISVKNNGSAKPVTVNTELLKSFYNSLNAVANELYADSSQLLPAILKLPEVVVNNTEVLTEEEWQDFAKQFDKTISLVLLHRKNEGKSLENDLLQRLAAIEQKQSILQQLEPRRKEKIRENLSKLLDEQIPKEAIDSNRLEQELIYYIEKIDISEEQVRLTNHCNYFREVLNGTELSKGKKLGFILQEFGREINTTGSKANDSDIQRIVVEMKDELEKMKEQILNVL